MARLVMIILGVLLIVLGGIALLGAVELVRSGASTEETAQGLLVPASLFAVGGFLIWAGWQRRGGN